MFITIHKIFKKIRRWFSKNIKKPRNIEAQPIWLDTSVQPTGNIMLNRSKRRYLASKLRKATHNARTFNTKAHQLPHSCTEGDLQEICRLAGVTTEELYNVRG